MFTITAATEPGSDRPNEDWHGATHGAFPLVATVIDGVGSSGSGCCHGTAWYAARLGTALLHHAATGGPLQDSLAAAIRDVAALHPACDVRHPASPAAAVAALRADHEQTDWLVLADVSIVLETSTDGTTAISDHRVDEIAPQEQAAVAGRALGSGEHDTALDELVQAQLRWRNQQGGYWVAQGDPAAAEHALTGQVPTAELRRALLASDGAMRLASWGLLTAESALVSAVSSPADLIRRTRRTERADPRGHRFPRYKCRDDATALLITQELP